MCAVTIVDRFTSTTLQIIFFILLHIRQRRRRGGQRSRRGVSGSGTTVGGGGHVSVSRAVRLDSHVVQGHGLSKAHSCPEALYPGGQWSTVAESCRSFTPTLESRSVSGAQGAVEGSGWGYAHGILVVSGEQQAGRHC